MVNFIGRLFVMLLFCGSMMLLALSIGLYANHVSWKSASRDTPGVMDKLQARIGERAYGRDRAVERYNFAYNVLGQVEADRARRQYYHQAKFAMLLTGKDEKGELQPTPAYQLEFEPGTDVPGGNLLMIRMIPANNLVIQARGEPLRSQQAMQTALATRNREILDLQANIQKLQRDLAALTDEMQGTADKPGLIRRKEIMADARVRAINQQEFLKPALANRFAEATLALEREQDLRRRLAQLNRGDRPSGD
jgi:hypothetical protein